MLACQHYTYSSAQAWPAGPRCTHCQQCAQSVMLKVCVYTFRGVEKALDQSVTPPVQAEASEEAAPAGGEEANGPTPEEIAEAEAKVLTFNLQNTWQC